MTVILLAGVARADEPRRSTMSGVGVRPGHLAADLTVRGPPERGSVALALPTVNIAVELAPGGGQVR